MKIGIDYRLAASSNRGMGRYCREIVAELQSLDSHNEFILYVDTPFDTKFAPNFRVEMLGSSNFIIGEQIHLARAVSRDKLDVLWSPSNTFPLRLPKRLKLIVTIHDLIFMQHATAKHSLKQRIGRIYRRIIVTMGKRRINHCLSVSEYSASEIRRQLGKMEVGVTYNCIDKFYAKAKAIPAVCREEFYFTLSGDAPSKNLQFLIDYFKQYKPDIKLVIAGLPNNSPMRNQSIATILFVEAGVSDEQLISLYRRCKAFLFLSLQEGFGIPALEALVCEAPIICSNTTSLPEVVGEFGIQIAPQDSNALTEALERIEYFKVDINKRDVHIEKFLEWKTTAQVVYNTMKA